MALRVEHLTKSFGTNRAVDDLNFEMTRPGVFGLIGTNGAGKTTTIRMILGIMPPDAGRALWDGRQIARETLAFGYLPEERGIYMKNKVLEQLVYFGALRGMRAAQARASALRYLERLGIAQYAGVTADKLSKGNQQKVQLIAALIHEPVLIFMDEPFSGFDPVNAEMMRDLIAELVAGGCYIVMSSHQMETVEEYCEDLLILHRGRTMLTGNLQAIKAGYARTNLVVSAREDVSACAAAAGLVLIEAREGEREYRIEGEAMANAFLASLVAAGVYPHKFVVRAPSLREIFIEKVGESA